MEYQEAMQQLKRLRSLMVAGGDDSVFSADDRQIIEALHLSELGCKIRDCSCRDRYTDAVLVLFSTLKTRKIMAKDQKYQLRPGVLIWVGTQVYTNHNLNDEVAAAYLEMNPEALNKFERVPEDYKSPAEQELAAKAKAKRNKANAEG